MSDESSNEVLAVLAILAIVVVVVGAAIFFINRNKNKENGGDQPKPIPPPGPNPIPPPGPPPPITRCDVIEIKNTTDPNSQEPQIPENCQTVDRQKIVIVTSDRKKWKFDPFAEVGDSWYQVNDRSTISTAFVFVAEGTNPDSGATFVPPTNFKVLSAAEARTIEPKLLKTICGDKKPGPRLTGFDIVLNGETVKQGTREELLTSNRYLIYSMDEYVPVVPKQRHVPLRAANRTNVLDQISGTDSLMQALFRLADAMGFINTYGNANIEEPGFDIDRDKAFFPNLEKIIWNGRTTSEPNKTPAFADYLSRPKTTITLQDFDFSINSKIFRSTRITVSEPTRVDRIQTTAINNSDTQQSVVTSLVYDSTVSWTKIDSFDFSSKVSINKTFNFAGVATFGKSIEFTQGRMFSVQNTGSTTKKETVGSRATVPAKSQMTVSLNVFQRNVTQSFEYDTDPEFSVIIQGFTKRFKSYNRVDMQTNNGGNIGFHTFSFRFNKDFKDPKNLIFQFEDRKNPMTPNPWDFEKMIKDMGFNNVQKLILDAMTIVRAPVAGNMDVKGTVVGDVEFSEAKPL